MSSLPLASKAIKLSNASEVRSRVGRSGMMWIGIGRASSIWDGYRPRTQELSWFSEEYPHYQPRKYEIGTQNPHFLDIYTTIWKLAPFEFRISILYIFFTTDPPESRIPPYPYLFYYPLFIQPQVKVQTRSDYRSLPCTFLPLRNEWGDGLSVERRLMVGITIEMHLLSLNAQPLASCLPLASCRQYFIRINSHFEKFRLESSLFPVLPIDCPHPYSQITHFCRPLITR